MSVTFVIGGTIIVCSFLNDASGTIKMMTAFITIWGTTWLVTRIISPLNRENAQIVNFGGWSLAAIPGIGILSTALRGLPEILARFGSVADSINKFTTWLDNLPIFK